MGICCKAQETKTGAEFQPGEVRCGGRWEGVSKGRGIYVYLWELMLLNCDVGEDS